MPAFAGEAALKECKNKKTADEKSPAARQKKFI